ncbi:MAG: DUF6528 family protein [Rubripirellula sp.]
MNRVSKTCATFVVCFLACLFATATLATKSFADNTHDLICCGGDEVFVIAIDDPTFKKWSWRSEQSPSIPKDLGKRFRSTDDCKPYEGGLVLITSSSGVVALIDRPSKACRFLAESRNAHSACLLPGRQIAVASSFGGDQIQFFDRDDVQQPATEVQSLALLGAHGLVWDTQRDCLWALGEKELLVLVADANAKSAVRWSVRSRTPLPSNGGHDLSPQHDAKHLYVTTDTQVLIFECDKLSFTVAEGFGDQAKVKSVDRHATSNRIVFHQATSENWWSDTIRFADAKPIQLGDQRLYKIRWDMPAKDPNH